MKIQLSKPESLMLPVLLPFALFLGCTRQYIPKPTPRPILIEEETAHARQEEGEKPTKHARSAPNKLPPDSESLIVKFYERPSILENSLVDSPVNNNSGKANSLGIVLNNRVLKHLLKFHLKERSSFAKYLERSGRYLPLMKQILQKYGLPEELVYIALIESGFNIKAVSPAKACGPWQLLRGTGLKYGLRIDYWVDERHDPVKSTEAAAKYLRDLYSLFGCWNLAVASYNAGEARVRSAIKNAESRDFWAIIEDNHLPSQTREFVPKFMAATIIGQEYEAFGFKNLNFLTPIRYDYAKVKGGISLELLAQYSGISYEEIKRLNPELKKGITPLNLDSYKLKIPYGRKNTFLRNWSKWEARIPAFKDESNNYYRVKKGDTLWDISKKNGISLKELKQINGLKDPSRLKLNQILLIPRGQPT